MNDRYVKLDDVCNKASSNIAQNTLNSCVGVYPIYGASGLITHVNFYQRETEYIAIVKDGAGVGRTMLLPAKSSVIGTLQYILPDFKQIDIRYLYFVIVYMELGHYFSGATIPHIYFRDYQKECFKLPSLARQKSIADILQNTDSIIEKRQRQLALLDDLVKSRFIEMFGDPVVNSMNWTVLTLGECLVGIENGKSFVCSNEPRRGTAPAVLKLSAATYGDYRPQENKAMFNGAMFVASAEVHGGDLLFTRKNTPELVGMCAYVPATPRNLMMPDLIFRLNINEKCDKVYIWKLINHPLFRNNIASIASGSAKSMSNISKERLGKMKIPVPPLALQTQFAAFVAQVDKSKFEIQKSLKKLETLKKALMQQYFG